jgi:hypothetical protein
MNANTIDRCIANLSLGNLTKFENSATRCRGHGKRDFAPAIYPATFLPSSREDTLQIGERPFTIGFAVRKLSIVTRILERHRTAPVRLAVEEFPFVAASEPVLGAMTRLASFFPFTPVDFGELAGPKPLQSAGTLRQTIGTAA